MIIQLEFNKALAVPSSNCRKKQAEAPPSIAPAHHIGIKSPAGTKNHQRGNH
jgi:hypothetical protein